MTSYVIPISGKAASVADRNVSKELLAWKKKLDTVRDEFMTKEKRSGKPFSAISSRQPLFTKYFYGKISLIKASKALYL